MISINQILSIVVFSIRILILIPLIGFLIFEWKQRNINGEAKKVRRIILRFVFSIIILVLNLVVSRLFISIGRPEIVTGTEFSLIFLFSSLVVLYATWLSWVEIERINKKSN